MMKIQNTINFLTCAYRKELVAMLLQGASLYRANPNWWVPGYFLDVNLVKIVQQWLILNSYGVTPTQQMMRDAIIQYHLQDDTSRLVDDPLSRNVEDKLPLDVIDLLKDLDQLYAHKITNPKAYLAEFRKFVAQAALTEKWSPALDALARGDVDTAVRLVNSYSQTMNPVHLADESFFNTLPNLKEEIIPGILRRSYIAVINGHSKSFKSWAMLHCAISVAIGRSWLGFGALPARKSLYVNLELEEEEFKKRVDIVCAAMGITRESLFGKLDFLNLKGTDCSLHNVTSHLRTLNNPEDPWHFLVIDPTYKLLSSGAGMDSENIENNNTVIGALFCDLEEFAKNIQAAIFLVHHFKKGNSADTLNIDSGSGGGTFGRAPDAIFSIHPLRDADKSILKDCYVIKSDLRYYSDVGSFGVRMTFPLFQRDELLNIDNVAGKTGRPNKNNMVEALEVLGDGTPLTSRQWQSRVYNQHRMGEKAYRVFRDDLVQDELVVPSGPVTKHSTTYTLTEMGKLRLASSATLQAKFNGNGNGNGHGLGSLKKRK
jgi:hypothetical protein